MEHYVKIFQRYSSMSLSRLLSLLIIVTISILGLALLLILSYQLNEIVSEQENKFIHEQLDEMILNINNVLSFYSAATKDISRLPIITQAVMQPEQNKGNIIDFFDNVRLFEHKANLTLLDFSGKLIYTNSQHHKEIGKVSVKNISELTIDNRITINKASKYYYWNIYLPIIYNDSIEGLLIAHIPFKKAVEYTSSLSALKTDYVRFIKNGHVIDKYGNSDNLNTEVYTKYLERYKLGIEYHVSTSRYNEQRNSLISQLLLTLTIATVISTFISLKIGRHLLTRPITVLQDQVISLAEGDSIKPNLTGSSILEIANLKQNFHLMYSRIKEREKELLEKNNNIQDLYNKLKENQAQLVQSEKMASLGQLAAGVAHEINNPLGYIMGNLQVLEEYVSIYMNLLSIINEYISSAADSSINQSNEILSRYKEYSQQEDINYINNDIHILLDKTIKGAVQVSEIVKGLKSFSRIDDTNSKDFSLNECIEDTIPIIWNEIKYNCILEKDLGDIKLTSGYPGKINQVILNLLINASQAVGKHGIIQLKTYNKDGFNILEVSDNGTGISESELSSIFNPFYTTKPVGEGTGLGLSISYTIIDEHEGRITVESEVGIGTVFKVYLPEKKD